jgi:hypothetical protein
METAYGTGTASPAPADVVAYLVFVREQRLLRRGR